MKYIDTKIVFREVPDETSLAINISGCEIHCEGCHSSWLWKDEGKTLDCDSLENLIKNNPGITCVCFMGGKQNDVEELADYIKSHHPELKTAWYTGLEIIEGSAFQSFDYFKVGPYKKECGGLDRPLTNQRFYKVVDKENFKAEDITNRFYETQNKD